MRNALADQCIPWPGFFKGCIVRMRVCICLKVIYNYIYNHVKEFVKVDLQVYDLQFMSHLLWIG